jgi:beta-N-acetylhexosaminidase
MNNLNKNLSLGQLLTIGISGTELSQKEADFIVSNDIGGVILFTRNFSNLEQLVNLTHQIQSLSKLTTSRAPLFISVDCEGGRVFRFKKDLTQWPALVNIGKIDSAQVAFSFANYMGQELSACGINLNFAPCVDVFSNPENKVIGDRSISSDPELVAKHASALVRGYLKAGIIPCIKHFPGHGHTWADSHDELPVSDLSFNDLEKIHLIPFKKALKSKAEMIMTSHILFKQIDAKNPVTLSDLFINKTLKLDFRFKGIVISDDLGMKALTLNYSTAEIVEKALLAGVDHLLYCNEPEAPVVAIDTIYEMLANQKISRESLQEKVKKILDFKERHISSVGSFDLSLKLKQAKEIVGRAEHQAFARAVEQLKVPSELL